MSEILSKVNTNTGLIFSLKGQVDASNAFFQQEITDLQNEKYDKTGGLISGDVEISGNVALTNTEISAVSQITFQENVVLRGGKVAIGNLAGEINQGSNTIAVGNFSGRVNQTNNAVAIGINAGNTSQSDSCIGIGNLAGENTQGLRSIAIGRVAGRTSQGANSVAVGSSAGSTSQGQRAVAIGNESGETGQSNNSIAIGERAGRTNLGFESIAIGRNSGNNSQQRTINIGENAGSNTSLEYSISVGIVAGQNNQGANAIAIGRVAGQNNQGTNAMAMGFLTGQVNQGESAVAVGSSAGQTNQGQFAVAIGHRAGQSNQDNNSIVINATGDVLNTDASNAFFVSPVRERSGTHLLQYDTSNNEICYSNTIDVSGNLNITADDIDIVARQGVFSIDSDTSRMEVLIGENIDGSNLALIADASGNEIGSNTKLTIQGDGDVVIKNQTIGTGIIELNTETLTFTGAGLEDVSAGSVSGQHLRINLNGTFYKIALLDDT